MCAANRIIKTLIIEDDINIREFIADAIAGNIEFCVHGKCETLSEAREIINPEIDLILLDLHLPDGNGLDLLRELKSNPDYSHTKILVLTVFHDQKNVIDAIEFGADGYLLKDIEEKSLHAAIEEVFEGGAPLSPQIAQWVLEKLREGDRGKIEALETHSNFTRREIELLHLLARGLSYNQCAKEMAISAHTIGDYVKTIYKKLEVSSRNEAVFEAMQIGVIKI